MSIFGQQNTFLMRKLLLSLGLVFCSAVASNGQVTLFSENWNTGGPGWNMNVPTGPEGADANFFTISAAEGGNVTPNLGAPGSCGVANNGDNTLHVTSVFNPTGGAAYDAGGLCGLLFCPQADRRCESPTINCTGQNTISVNFIYIENGQGLLDDAKLYYFDGTTWTMIDNMPKTLTGCGGQGLWVSRTVPLPASANNNPNVKIAFHWMNNDDGAGSDPSFAVDNITVTAPSAPAPPVAAFTASATSVCIGQGVNFTDNSTGGPTSWLWTFPSGSPGAAITQNVSTVIWNTAGTYTVTLQATNASGSSTATTVITVNPNPTVTVTSSQQTICAGNNTTLTASGASSYSWQPGNLPGSPVIVTPAATTTYTVTGTSAAGCQDTAQYTVYVQSCPGPVAIFSASDSTICIGQLINFTDLSTGAPTSWAWTFPSGSPGSASSQNVTGVSWAVAGTYTVTLTATNGFGSNSSTMVITVVPFPTVTASANPATICSGQQSTLTGSGAVTYNWTPGPLTGNPVVVTPASTTTYTVVGTDAQGCTGTGQVVVTVTPCLVPAADFVANDTTICVGDCINFTDLSTNGPNAWSWTFSGAATPTSAVQNPTNICYNSPGVFAVTLVATNNNGSGSITKTGYITVNPPPAANAGPDVTICTGQQTILNATGGVGYLWQPGNQPSPSYTVTPVTTTTYTVLVTDAIGCTASDQVIVTVQPCVPPTAALAASGTSICAGDCIDFTDNSTGGPTSWQWSFPSATPTSSTSQNPTSICYSTPGTYTVTLIVTNAYGSDTNTIVVSVGTPPTADAGATVSIAIGNQTTLTATGGTGTYSWSPTNGLGSPGSPTTTASPTVTTTYTVTFTDANGCSATDTVTVQVIEAYGLFIPGSFSPNGDGANDILYVYGAGIKTMEFYLYDRYGEKVFETHSVNDGWDGTLRGKPMNGGVFAWYCTVQYFDGNSETLQGDLTLVR
jgi:gliding motility-associated-like protein